MQKVYTKRREPIRYTADATEPQGEKMTVKFLFKMIVVALVICTVICIKRIDANLYNEIKMSIDYILNTNYTYSDIITGIKDSIDFFKQLIVL